MKAFEHGGDIVSFAKTANCEVSEVIDLSSNINFIKPKCTIDFNTLDIAPYPNYDKLYNTIAKHYEVKQEQLELFNGGSSAIFTLFKHLGLKRCAIYSPAYLEYKKASISHGYKLQIINRFKNMDTKVKKNSLVIFVNPSTPDGMTYDVKKLFSMWKKQNCTVLIDESFIEFCDAASIIHEIKNYKKLYVLKSMTKFYSSAGIRLGTLISNEKNIAKLKAHEPMWKLSTFDMHYILEVLKDKPFVQVTKEITTKNRTFLAQKLIQYPFISEILPSFANYLLIKLKKTDAKKLQQHLLSYKIMVRSCENFDCLDKHYVRIAIKDKTSLKQLCKALDSF